MLKDARNIGKTESPRFGGGFFSRAPGRALSASFAVVLSLLSAHYLASAAWADDASRGVPDYSEINTPSRDPDKPWYLRDFFRDRGRWRLETSVDNSELKLGMYELTQYPDQVVTESDKEVATRLISDSLYAAVKNGWMSKEKGLSDGYEAMFKDPVHFVNREYVYDGETLNPEKPEVLMYYETEQGNFLLGVMYIAVAERGPQVAGALSVWHYHIDRRVCYENGILPIGQREESGQCAEGVTNTRSPEMLHVWFFNHPDGRFSTNMGLPADLVDQGVREVLNLPIMQ